MSAVNPDCFVSTKYLTHFVCGRYFSFAPVAVKLVQGAERFFLVGWMISPAWLESQDKTIYNNIT